MACKQLPPRLEEMLPISSITCPVPQPRKLNPVYKTLDPQRGFQTINPQVYTDKVAKTSDNDARLINPFTGHRIVLSQQPIDGSVASIDMYDSDRSQQKVSDYKDISLGQITYYVDKSIANAFYEPNFTQASKEVGVTYIDPMGSIKPQYTMVPKPIDIKTAKDIGLSYLYDTAFHRENIMASQMTVRNQQRWEPYNV